MGAGGIGLVKAMGAGAIGLVKGKCPLESTVCFIQCCSDSVHVRDDGASEHKKTRIVVQAQLGESLLLRFSNNKGHQN